MHTDKMLEKMLEQQSKDNDKFINMPVERIDDVVTLIIPPEDVIVSKTVIVVNDGVVVLRRFINRKLWSVEFTNGLNIDKVQGWFDLSDDKFLRLAKIGMLQS